MSFRDAPARWLSYRGNVQRPGMGLPQTRELCQTPSVSGGDHFYGERIHRQRRGGDRLGLRFFAL